MNWTWPTLPIQSLWLQRRTILLTLGGSRAYGTNNASSDTDVRGVCVPPANIYHGFAEHFEQAELRSDGADCVVYEARKFCKLAAAANPNILEILFTRPEDRIIVHPVLGQMLLDARDSFLSRKAAHTFSGYALGQMARISQFAFDVKDPTALKQGVHLVRLLRMGLEILKGEGVNVYRPDREELNAIRAGAWTHEELIKWADRANAELHGAIQKSPLPWGPDMKKLDTLCCKLVESAIQE